MGRCIAGLSHSQRALSASGLLRELADQHTSGELLLVDNIELLFDRSLKLDPLTLLKQLSRVRRVVLAIVEDMIGTKVLIARELVSEVEPVHGVVGHRQDACLLVPFAPLLGNGLGIALGLVLPSRKSRPLCAVLIGILKGQP